MLRLLRLLSGFIQNWYLRGLALIRHSSVSVPLNLNDQSQGANQAASCSADHVAGHTDAWAKQKLHGSSFSKVDNKGDRENRAGAIAIPPLALFSPVPSIRSNSRIHATKDGSYF
jgi:hypothetical protein